MTFLGNLKACVMLFRLLFSLILAAEQIMNMKRVHSTVAATDRCPFANECPRQEIQSLTNQSTGRAIGYTFLLVLK